jgi:hypothetical protein
LPSEAAYCVEVSPDTFPSGNRDAAMLTVLAEDEATMLRVSLYGATGVVATADGIAARRRMLLTDLRQPSKDAAAENRPWVRFFVVVSREDARNREKPGSFAIVRAAIEPEKLSEQWFVKTLSEGHAFRQVIESTRYNELLAFAKCDWLAPEERQSPAGCLDGQMAVLGRSIYPFVSSLAGRSTEGEFHEGRPRAARSEPMVVFFGVGGLNKVLLLDCRDTGGSADTRRCHKYAEPWQTTFQRAKYFWAVYIEDDQVPFDTSIDVEFKARAPSVDYEEYDARALTNQTFLEAKTTRADQRHVLRVGFRRFRVREAPIAVQVAFSRQGPNYGLRQWVRVYRKFSSRPWVVAGALVVPVSSIETEDIELVPIQTDDGSPPTLARITLDTEQRQVFAGFIWRWPQIRGRAENEATARRRLLINLVPDAVFGIGLPTSRHNVYYTGGSWPFLWDRLSFTAGLRHLRVEVPTAGFTVGQVVPVGTDSNAVRTTQWTHDVFLGLSFELIRSR